MTQKVAIVTGANKGIGYEIVRGLCRKFDGVVYLTSRDRARGEAAVAVLEKEGLQPKLHLLDVADKFSVQSFRDHIQTSHGGIDILVNNAGVASPTEEDFETIVHTNYGGLLNVEQLLFPLLRKNARVINMSSCAGHLSNLRNQSWIDRLSKKDLTREDVSAFVNWFLESKRNGSFKTEDFADGGTIAAYRVSKIALTALTFIQQRELEDRGVIVNALHPGIVATEMTSNVGFYSPAKSAETPLYLVLDAPSTLRGSYVWFDRTVVDWYDYKADYFFKFESLFVDYDRV